MSTTQPGDASATQGPDLATAPLRFEVTGLPVADVDRAKDFYMRLGWRLDADFNPTPDSRGVQFTPLGSSASIQFGSGGAWR
jgi:catechol 2,3-dioxygenase-like lactoylglutathione lyase family enzyme